MRGPEAEHPSNLPLPSNLRRVRSSLYSVPAAASTLSLPSRPSASHLPLLFTLLQTSTTMKFSAVAAALFIASASAFTPSAFVPRQSALVSKSSSSALSMS